MFFNKLKNEWISLFIKKGDKFQSRYFKREELIITDKKRTNLGSICIVYSHVQNSTIGALSLTEFHKYYKKP